MIPGPIRVRQTDCKSLPHGVERATRITVERSDGLLACAIRIFGCVRQNTVECARWVIKCAKPNVRTD